MSRPTDNSGGDARGLVLISSAVAQMVAPILIGVWLDNRNGWSPWGLALGAVLGVGGGFASLVWMSQKQNRDGGTPPSDT